MAATVQGRFCPIVMASEILGPRWSMVLLSELLEGSSRFNELRRGIPRISPGLLSKRLKELQDWGLIERRQQSGGEVAEYVPTDAAMELKPVIYALGCWTQKWIDARITVDTLDAPYLMWHIRRNFNPDPMPKRKTVIQFIYPEVPIAERNYWMILTPGEDVDLCSIDPGYNVDLFVAADLMAMTHAFLGQSTLNQEIGKDTITLTGDSLARANFRKWFVQSSFAQKTDV